MRYRIDVDPFEQNQPPIEFYDDLMGNLHEKPLNKWNKRKNSSDEIFIKRAYIKDDFPNADDVLETVYDDFHKFLTYASIEQGNDFCFHTQLCNGMKEESYRITVSDAECLIESSDTEGIRRALYYIEDEMHRREGSFLPKGEIYRYAVIKTRISRGFLNPHYCPGCDGELEDDTEYYPDNYLSRLAHDGVNAIWVQERFRVIVPSDIIPEYGQNAQERVNRLNRLINRCKRYGIKVYLEGIEPASTLQNEALKNHPDLLGQNFGNEFTFCSSTEKGKAYIRESTKRLFQICPDLAGLVNISVGEAMSHCASLDVPLACPHCLELGSSKAQVLDNCEKEIIAGMREVKPDAELISWAYAMRMWKESDMKEYFDIRNNDTISMINFEDLGEVEQVGKTRIAMDYWLSYTGPGKVFKYAAESGEKNDAPVFAKIQVCTSHEISTVPYIPVPGILYDKYRYMHQHNVTGVLYCWYFGNYPSMMNKAAGELAFAPFYPSKDEFLEHIAGIYWGSNAKEAASAYKKFEEGYQNYPVNMSFEWHGPMGDAPVWPLHLEPVDLPISRSYKLMNMVGSDRLGETMLLGHSYDDVLTLCRDMSEKWNEGIELFSQLQTYEDKPREEQKNVASALQILLSSGYNIYKSYRLRDQLGFLKDEPIKILEQMRNIVFKEKENSGKLIKLCEEDKRLGYHCEAMGFKFFPEKLKWRICLLDELLDTEFKSVENRVAQGKIPLPFYFGRCEESHRYIMQDFNKSAENWECFMRDNGDIDNDIKIRIMESSENICIEIHQKQMADIIINPEFEMFHPYVPVLISDNGIEFVDAASYGLFENLQDAEKQKWDLCTEIFDTGMCRKITLKKSDFFQNGVLPFRLAISTKDGKSMWQIGDRYYYRLIFGTYSPDSYVFIVPKSMEDI